MKKTLATLSLMAGTFFLPFGYDILFYTLMPLIGGYWPTIVIFYCLSGAFFGLYFLLSRNTS